MREIKYRAWHKVMESMCYNVTTDLLNRDYLVFMQYTGLKDKKDTEIYEGDIISEGNGSYSVCKWVNSLGCYAFVPVETFGEKESNLSGCTVLNDVYRLFCDYGVDTFFENQTPRRYVEVVGNIYENQELL